MKKTLIITGGSSGIGLAIAKRFIANAYHVCNLDITESDVGEFYYCDMTDHEQVHDCIKRIANKYTIDVLVSNAGMHLSANIEQTSHAQFLDVFNLNVKGAFSVTQAVLPYLKAQQHGVVIFMGSDQSTVGKANSFAYNLSKHALASMAKTTALDYARYNIRANALCPGTIDTPLYRKAIQKYCDQSGADIHQVHADESALQPLGRIGQPDDVAAMAVFLASEDAAFITGSLHAIDGGYTSA